MIDITDIKVRGYHLDVYGHVNNARYLEFLEEGRWAFVEGKMDLEDWAGKGQIFSVVNININYRLPAFLNDLLHIETELVKIGRRSSVIRQKVRKNGSDNVVADADVTFVFMNSQTGKAIILEGELLEALEALMN
jgi:thioesterase-3